jgi:hypothetical protein
MLENKKSVNGESMAAYDDTRNGNAIINKVLPRKRSLNGLRLEAIIKNK